MEEDMAERDFSEIARLSERYNKDPKSRIFVQLADAYRKNNMIDEALEILQKGLQHHPNYGLAYLILGKCYFDKRMYAQAKDSFEKTLSFDPQNIVALRMLAQICETTKDEEGQISAYKGILTIDPFDASAKEKLDRLEALRKKEPLYTMSMAEEYEHQGDLTKALEIYEHLLFTDPTDILLQEKVKQLKEKTGGETQKAAEEKFEKLQVETFFKPEDLEKPQQVEPSAPQPDTIQPVQEPEPVKPMEKVEEPQQPTIQEAPEQKTDAKVEEKLEILQPFGEEPSPPKEELDILKPVEATEEEKSEEPTPIKLQEETAASPVEETPRDDKTTPPVDVQAAPESTEEEEIMSLEDFLTEEPSEEVEETAPISEAKEESPPAATEPIQTETTQLAPEPEVRTEEPPLSTPEEKPIPIKEVEPTPSVQEPKEEIDQPPQPMSEEQEPEIKLKPEEPEEKTPPAVDSSQTTEQKPAPPEQQPGKPAEKKEPEKPKEEDFKSFQDWLSGLLK